VTNLGLPAGVVFGDRPSALVLGVAVLGQIEQGLNGRFGARTSSTNLTTTCPLRRLCLLHKLATSGIPAA
jgi:hypothetical protein